MMPVAILCGGYGTRLGSLTKDTPKYLVDVAGQPFALHQLALLKSHGYRDIVLCLGHQATQIMVLLGQGQRFGVKIRYSYDGAPKGTAAAVNFALPLLGPRFFVVYGDAYLDCDYVGIERAYLARDQHNRNLLTTFEDVDYGLSIFSARAFRNAYARHDWGPHPRNLPALHEALKRAHDLTIYPMASRFREMGSPEGLKELDTYLRARSSDD